MISLKDLLWNDETLDEDTNSLDVMISPCIVISCSGDGGGGGLLNGCQLWNPSIYGDHALCIGC